MRSGRCTDRSGPSPFPRGQGPRRVRRRKVSAPGTRDRDRAVLGGWLDGRARFAHPAARAPAAGRKRLGGSPSAGRTSLRAVRRTWPGRAANAGRAGPCSGRAGRRTGGRSRAPRRLGARNQPVARCVAALTCGSPRAGPRGRT